MANASITPCKDPATHRWANSPWVLALLFLLWDPDKNNQTDEETVYGFLLFIVALCLFAISLQAHQRVLSQVMGSKEEEEGEVPTEGKLQRPSLSTEVSPSPHPQSMFVQEDVCVCACVRASEVTPWLLGSGFHVTKIILASGSVFMQAHHTGQGRCLLGMNE